MFLALGVQFPAWDIVSGFTSHVYLRTRGDRRGGANGRSNGAELRDDVVNRSTGMRGSVGTVFSEPSWRADPGTR